jgi:hypothetical protein
MQIAESETAWTQLIPDTDWAIYKQAIQIARDSGVECLLGGGFALSAYTHRWRDAKDLDFIVRAGDKAALITALTNSGFSDFYDRVPYDRGWIYRSVRDRFIVDVIWRMANRRADVDEAWFQNARSIEVRDETLRIVPPEELLWQKLYVLQRDRCDWPDVLNMLAMAGGEIDWRRMVARLEEDTPLLHGLLLVLAWMCPGKVQTLPRWLREQFNLPETAGHDCDEHRVRLLDSRAWFATFRTPAQRLDI